MKACVKCGQELPDDALHCVFCGAKQKPPGAQQEAVAQPDPPNLDELAGAKTIGVSGHLTREALGLPAPPPAAPPPAAPAPPPAAPPPVAPPPAAPPPGAAPDGYRPGPFETPPVSGIRAAPAIPGIPRSASAGAGGATPGYGGPPMADAAPGYGGPPMPGAVPGYGGPAMPGAGPGPGGGGSAEMSTIVAGRQQIFGAPPAMPGGGPPAMPGGGAPAMPGGVAGAPGMAMGPPSLPAGPVTVALDPIPPMAQPHTPPPFLASQTLQRMGAPQEPWAETLGILMLVLGIVLIACFVVPWRIATNDVAFSWTQIADAAGKHKLSPLLIGVTGVLAVVLGLLPLRTLPRGLAAAAVGFTSAAIMTLVVAPWVWTNLLAVVAVGSLIPGLLLRSQYQGALLPRVLTTVGVLATMIPVLVPVGGEVALANHIEAIGGGAGVRMALVSVLMVAWDLAPLFGLLVWLPAPGHAGAGLLAWLLIARPLLQSVVTVLLMPHPNGLGTALQGGLHAIVLEPMAATVWLALIGYGIATLVGKQLEHQ